MNCTAVERLTGDFDFDDFDDFDNFDHYFEQDDFDYFDHGYGRDRGFHVRARGHGCGCGSFRLSSSSAVLLKMMAVGVVVVRNVSSVASFPPPNHLALHLFHRYLGDHCLNCY